MDRCVHVAIDRESNFHTKTLKLLVKLEETFLASENKILVDQDAVKKRKLAANTDDNPQ